MGDTALHEKRKHFRGKARPGAHVGLHYREANKPLESAREAMTRNIGVGGAFIVTNEPLPVGTRLAIVIHVPIAGGDDAEAADNDDKSISVAAEVRWTVETDDQGPGASPEGADLGMGVQFYDLDVHATLKLTKYFATLTGRDVAP